MSSSPSLHATELPIAGSDDRAAEHGTVLRNPYDWKSAFALASALFMASLALAPAPAMDHKKFAAEINTKTLKAAAAVTIPPEATASRSPLRFQ